ncbi:MAG: DUF1292 domain-containing protein [Oscillospiraceae bacterium]|jgi:uncharacterized protein YrzB (UPF0473 family)|nr:DUF1292 domain-containing protein [Oscillospiraceae bacterium]
MDSQDSRADWDSAEDVEEEAEVVVFVDENDREYEFEVLDELVKDGTKYLALVALEDSVDADGPEADELVIVKVVAEGDGETLLLLEDETEFEVISALFTERLSEFFAFTDSDASCCDCAESCPADCDCNNGEK